MNPIINNFVPSFSLSAYCDGEFKTITNKDVLGQWSVLFFYPADFSPVSEVELAGLTACQNEFQRLGVRIFAISTDSHFVHKAWVDRSESIQQLWFPLVGDRTGDLCRAMGAMSEGNIVLHPATYIVNAEGEIKIAEMYDENIERRPDELIRKVKAAIFVEEHPGEACPADWNEGDQTIKPSIDLVGKI